MAKIPDRLKDDEVGLPDAWERFERAVDVVMKPKPKAKERPTPKGRVHRGKPRA
jgi:hypothetical protein